MRLLLEGLTVACLAQHLSSLALAAELVASERLPGRVPVSIVFSFGGVLAVKLGVRVRKLPSGVLTWPPTRRDCPSDRLGSSASACWACL